MTDWSIWPATNGPNTDVADPTDISRGIIFRLSATGWLKAIRFYRGTTNVGNWDGGDEPPQGQLYTLVDGLPVPGTSVTFTLSGTGWQVATLVTPVALSANVSYKAAVITQNYTATGGYFASGAGVGGIVQGIITAPDAGGNPSGIGSIQQGSFRQPTTGLQFPNQYFNGGNYWVDIVIADEDPGSDIRDAVGSIPITTLNILAVASKAVNRQADIPVGVSLNAASAKVADLAAAVTVGVTPTAVTSKAVNENAIITLTPVNITATAEASGAGTVAPVSEVLCSPWANYLDVPQRMKDKLPTLTEADWQHNLVRASEILWMLSGRRWYGGGCTETATLRSWPPMDGTGTWPYDPSWLRCGCWTAPFPFDHLTGFRHVQGPYAIQLPRAPITDIVSVTIDGEAFTDYTMLRNGWIERTDGGRWTVCGDTTSITYQYGEPPPLGGKQAAIDLAYELGLEQVGDDSCGLPTNVESVSRQGVTITRTPATEFQDNGRTGIPSVDRWLTAVNPSGRRARARVWSPDIPSAIRTPQ